MKLNSICIFVLLPLLLLGSLVPPLINGDSQNSVSTLLAKSKKKKKSKYIADFDKEWNKVILKASKALQDQAKWCEKLKAFNEARRFHQLTAMCTGDYEATQKVLAKLSGKPDDVNQKKYERQIEGQLKKMKSNGSKPLFEFFVAAYEAGRDDLSLRAGVIWEMCFFDQEMLDDAEWQWSESILRFLPGADGERIDGGELRQEGKWLSTEELEKADAGHSNISKPWVLTDGVMELSSNLPLKRVQRYIAFLCRFSLYFKQHLASDLGLRFSNRKFICILAKNREDYKKEVQRVIEIHGTGAAVGNEIGRHAYHTSHDFAPVLISPTMPLGGKIVTITDKFLMTSLGHETTHQLLYAGYGLNRAMMPTHLNAWAWEGMATYMELHRLTGHRFEILPGAGMIMVEGTPALDGYLLRAKYKKDDFLTLKQFVSQSNEDFYKISEISYQYACAVTYYFLTQAAAGDRQEFMKLIREVHTLRDSTETFANHFKDHGVDKLNEEFLAWLDEADFCTD